MIPKQGRDDGFVMFRHLPNFTFFYFECFNHSTRQGYGQFFKGGSNKWYKSDKLESWNLEMGCRVIF